MDPFDDPLGSNLIASFISFIYLFIYFFIIYLGSIIVQMVFTLNLKNKLKIFEMGVNQTVNQMILISNLTNADI